MSEEYNINNTDITEIKADNLPEDTASSEPSVSAEDYTAAVHEPESETEISHSEDQTSEQIQHADDQSSEADVQSSDQTAQASVQNDPYSKYNYFAPNTGAQGFPYSGYSNMNSGYQNPGFQNQGYPGQGYQNQQSGTAAQSGYVTSAPQYNGSYQQNTYFGQGQTPGYQNYQTNSQNQNYGSQGYQNANYQNQGYQNPQYQSNPYPSGQTTGYVSSIDSIYPGNAPHRQKVKKEKSGAAKFFAGLAMSAAFGLIAAGVFCLVTYFYKQQNPDLFTNTVREVKVTTTDNKNDAHLNLDPAEGTKVPSTSVIDGATFTGTDVSKVVEENMPAIVAIDCITESYNYFYGPYQTPSAGSGIIIQKNEKELMIATNNHVVSNTTDIKVKFIDGTTAPAKVKGKDSVSDLAVLSISLEDISEDTLNAIAIAKIGNSDELKVGEMAIAIGNALGYGQSVTVGYISGKDREITIDGQVFSGLLQTDAAINPGNSGGALLNLKGEVIGINNAKIGGSDVEGMGYAIPISKAQDILAEFVARETLTEDEQGFLGVIISTVNSSTAKMYNWPEGAYISEISKDSAADKAGLMVGDIITKADKVEIKTNKDLTEKIQSMRYGTTLTLTVQRRIDGEFQELEINVTLGQRPKEDTKEEDTKSNNKIPDKNNKADKEKEPSAN